MIRTNNLLNRSTTPVKLIIELFCSNESFERFEKDRQKVQFYDSKKKNIFELKLTEQTLLFMKQKWNRGAFSIRTNENGSNDYIIANYITELFQFPLK